MALGLSVDLARRAWATPARDSSVTSPRRQAEIEAQFTPTGSASRRRLLRPSGFDLKDLLSTFPDDAVAPRWEEALANACIEVDGLGGPWVPAGVLATVAGDAPHAPRFAPHGRGEWGRPQVWQESHPELEALVIDAGRLGSFWMYAALGEAQVGAPMVGGGRFDLTSTGGGSSSFGQRPTLSTLRPCRFMDC